MAGARPGSAVIACLDRADIDPDNPHPYIKNRRACAGASVQRCEMIWMRHANGGWMLLPALLSSGISECLVIPATVAHELGYASEVRPSVAA